MLCGSQAHGRVDITHPGNAASSCHVSAYSAVERQLAALEALAEEAPAARGYAELYAGRSDYQR